jgi:glycosidase
VYGVVPPLFGPRGLADVTARVPDLAALGVDALWIAPVQATDDPGAISYAITDHFAVREDYGTLDDLRALVRAAHARGVKVLLDVVPNHTSIGHPFYRDAEERGRASPYWSWYERDEAGVARWDFDWKHLRRLDLANPAVRRHLAEAFAFWIREAGVDGYRVDAAWGIARRAPGFWPALVRELEALRPDVILLSEASAREPDWARAGFDAAYDWTDALGVWAWDEAFRDPARAEPALAAALAPGAAAMPPCRVLRFLENNDTGARFVTRHGPERTRAAAALAFAVPGVALLFTGQEVGAAYEPYADPPPIAWERDPHGLRAHYARLARLREEVPALREGGYLRLEVRGEDGALAFVRDAGAGGRALVVSRLAGAGPVVVEWPFAADPPAHDLLAGRPAPPGRAGPGAIAVDVGGGAGAVILADAPSPERPR